MEELLGEPLVGKQPFECQPCKSTECSQRRHDLKDGELRFQVSALSQHLNFRTLHFYDHSLDVAFNQQQVHAYLAVLDRACASLLLLVLGVVLLRPQAGAVRVPAAALLVLLVTWIWAASMTNPVTQHSYPRHRTLIVAAAKLALMLLGFFFASYHHSMIPSKPLGPMSTLFLLISTTRAIACMILSLGFILPFRLHMCMLAVHLAQLAYYAVPPAAAQLCRCCPASLHTLHGAFSGLAVLVQPLTRVVVDAAQESRPAAVCGLCPGQQLAMFVLLAVGGALPAVIVYSLEYRARVRFVCSRPALFGTSLTRQEVGDHPRVLNRLLDACQVWAGLALLWQLLEVAYN